MIFTIGVLVVVVVFVAMAAYADVVTEKEVEKRKSMILRQIITVCSGAKDIFRSILIK
jgi:hypothetical protein